MEDPKLNILIVSYFFYPDKKVGALRTSYWYRNLASVVDARISVLTANSESSGEGVTVIPNDVQSGFALIKDEGRTWKKAVKNYLKTNKIEKLDFVIISGSPFMHFSLAGYFQKKYGSKVILDYRDPFANNPGFDNNRIKILVKQFFERGFNRMADGLITVNSFCADLIEGFNSKPNVIVQNGFDESVKPELKEVNTSQPSFAYTGKFYFDPEPIVRAMEETGSVMTYAGPDGKLMKSNSDKIKDAGFVTYPESVQLIADADVAIVQTYGEDFQSTTKLFDYIRCKRIILIVSGNYLHRGSLHEELKGYPNVFWSKNDEVSIAKAIEEIRKSDYNEISDNYADKYSRKNQMMKLVELINKLTE